MAKISIQNRLENEPISTMIICDTAKGFKFSLIGNDESITTFAINANDAQLLQSLLFMHIKELKR